MNEKLLLYLLGAVLWYFLKYRAEQEKKSRQPAPATAPPDVQAERKRETVVPELQGKAVKKRSTVSRQPLVVKGRRRGEEPASVPGSLEVLMSDTGLRETVTKTNMTHETNSILTNGMPEPIPASPAAKIGQELRSGRFDWQRAVIINELMQRKW